MLKVRFFGKKFVSEPQDFFFVTFYLDIQIISSSCAIQKNRTYIFLVYEIFRN
jgi:hypothetical protein